MFKPLFKSVKQADISSSGVFKYITIEVTFKGETDYFVRGYKDYDFHLQNMDHFVKELKQYFKDSKGEISKKGSAIEEIKFDIDGLPMRFRCIGGGRLQHNYKKIHILGYSQTYGAVDHNIAIKILKRVTGYPSENFSSTNEGY